MNIHCQCSRYIYPQAKRVIWEVLVITISAPYCLCFVFVVAIMVTLIYACPSEIRCYFGYIVMIEKLCSMGLRLGIIRIKIQWKDSVIKNVYFSFAFRNCGNKHSVKLVPMETSIRWPGTTLSLAVKCFHLMSTTSESYDSYWKKEVYFFRLTDLS